MGSRLGCARRDGSSHTSSLVSTEDSSPSSASDSEVSIPPVTTAVGEPLVGTTTAPVDELVRAVSGAEWRLSESEPPEGANWKTPELRLYVVWVIPGYINPRAFCGLHWGQGLSAYSGLLSLNGANHIGGLKWKRVYSLEEGEQAFSAEASRHRVDLTPVRRFKWQSN